MGERRDIGTECTLTRSPLYSAAHSAIWHTLIGAVQLTSIRDSLGILLSMSSAVDELWHVSKLYKLLAFLGVLDLLTVCTSFGIGVQPIYKAAARGRISSLL
jgi:hypothetical protein